MSSKGKYFTPKKKKNNGGKILLILLLVCVLAVGVWAAVTFLPLNEPDVISQQADLLVCTV